MDAVVHVNEWFNLGLALGIKQPILDRIRIQHLPSDCKREMLTKWLQRFGKYPSWNGLVRALRTPSVECYDIANNIELNHSYK